MLDYEALTKIQAAMLTAIILVAAITAYAVWTWNTPSEEVIRIGICADIDMPSGKAVWQGAVLAAEQVNAEGGILGRNITIVAEDNDSETSADIVMATNALTKLITIDKADFVMISAQSGLLPSQDICADNKKILLGLSSPLDNYTQRVLDDYSRYKYSFRLNPPNQTTVFVGILGDILTLQNYTGFTKVALLFQDFTGLKEMIAGLNITLAKYGVDVVYSSLVSPAVTDFASYFAAIEESGAEMLVPYIGTQASVSFVKEWYDRQSPCVIWGILIYAGESNFWELTEGKCEYVSFVNLPILSGYPLTNKTLPTREAYLQRWGTVIPGGSAVAAYDGIRFILPDAIKRAGTTETEAVIKTLENVNVETSMARHFVFTGSHDVMVGAGGPDNPAEDYVLRCYFQYQADDTLVPVKPKTIMEEAGATYKYPPWHGPWDNKQIP